MKDFEELKNIWHDQSAYPKMDHETVLKHIKKVKNSFANKLLLETIGMGLVILLFLIIWTNSTFDVWSTHVSMFILIVCCLYYIFVQFRDYRSINNSELLLKTPEEYIDYLKSYRRERYILNTRNYRIYSFFIGIASGLYLAEIYLRASLWIVILGLTITIAWSLVCYYFMRIYIRREENKVDEMIENLERLKRQFDVE